MGTEARKFRQQLAPRQEEEFPSLQEDYPNFSGNLDRLNVSYERPAKLHCASVDTPSRGAADDRLGARPGISAICNFTSRVLGIQRRASSG